MKKKINSFRGQSSLARLPNSNSRGFSICTLLLASSGRGTTRCLLSVDLSSVDTSILLTSTSASCSGNRERRGTLNHREWITAPRCGDFFAKAVLHPGTEWDAVAHCGEPNEQFSAQLPEASPRGASSSHRHQSPSVGPACQRHRANLRILAATARWAQGHPCALTLRGGARGRSVTRF